MPASPAAASNPQPPSPGLPGKSADDAAAAIAALGPATASQREAVLVGSSSFNQPLGFVIEKQLQRWGYQVVRKGVGGAGLARPDFRDMSRVLDELPISTKTAAVFVYLGVNDAQPLWLHPQERQATKAVTLPFGTPLWEARYAERTRGFYERICARGARRAIVLLPVDVNRSPLEKRLQRIRDLQIQAAAASTCATVLSTQGDAGHFEVGGVAKRLADGFHLSQFGANVVWNRIQGQVLALLSLSSRGAPGLAPTDGLYAGRVTPFF